MIKIISNRIDIFRSESFVVLSEQKVTLEKFVLTRVLFATAILTVALLSKIQLLKSLNEN